LFAFNQSAHEYSPDLTGFIQNGINGGTDIFTSELPPQPARSAARSAVSARIARIDRHRSLAKLLEQPGTALPKLDGFLMSVFLISAECIA
jgi:hypothetical protein